MQLYDYYAVATLEMSFFVQLNYPPLEHKMCNFFVKVLLDLIFNVEGPQEILATRSFGSIFA